MENVANTYQDELERLKKILANPESTLPALLFITTGRMVRKITRRKEPLPWQFNFSTTNSVYFAFT
jgi:hypothetical protein